MRRWWWNTRRITGVWKDSDATVLELRSVHPHYWRPGSSTPSKYLEIIIIKRMSTEGYWFHFRVIFSSNIRFYFDVTASLTAPLDIPNRWRISTLTNQSLPLTDHTLSVQPLSLSLLIYLYLCCKLVAMVTLGQYSDVTKQFTYGCH